MMKALKKDLFGTVALAAAGAAVALAGVFASELRTETSAAPVSDVKTVTLTKVGSFNDGWSDAKADDAEVVCSVTRASWRALCERVWVRPSFSWSSGGASLSDPAGPAQVIDALANAAGDLTSREFLVGLQGADADWRAAHAPRR